MSTYIENYDRLLGEGQKAGSVYTYYCPFPGCAGYRQRKFYVHPDFGWWNCQHCNHVVPNKVYREESAGHGGTWREFALMMGDPLEHWGSPENGEIVEQVKPLTPRRTRQVWTTLATVCNLSGAHREMMLARGVDPEKMGCLSATNRTIPALIQHHDGETLIRAGLCYEVEGELKPTKCIKPGRLIIPFWMNEEIRYFIGYQPCPPRASWQSNADYEPLKNRWVKYAGPVGYSSQFYGDVVYGEPFLIVTEGQIKAAAAIQRGFSCVGLQGIGNNHGAISRACRESGVQQVIILFDSQKTNQYVVDHHADRLARELLKKGIQPYRAHFQLDPRVENGEKMDVDGFLLHHPVEEFCRLLEGAKPYYFPEEVGDTSVSEEEEE